MTVLEKQSEKLAPVRLFQQANYKMRKSALSDRYSPRLKSDLDSTIGLGGRLLASTTQSGYSPEVVNRKIMSTHIRSTEKIAVFFCKHFQKLLRKMKDKKPNFLETSHSVVDGYTDSNGDIRLTQESEGFINAMVANGYTVTAFVRLSDSYRFVPFTDAFEKSAATAVNQRIFGKMSPEALSN
jgi:hypothetical protein